MTGRAIHRTIVATSSSRRGGAKGLRAESPRMHQGEGPDGPPHEATIRGTSLTRGRGRAPRASEIAVYQGTFRWLPGRS